MSPGRKPTEKVKTLHLQHLTNPNVMKHILTHIGIPAACLLTTLTGFAETKTLPYENHLSTQAEFSEFATLDADGDGWTWDFSGGCANSGGALGTEADDWLISPEFSLEPGVNYLTSVNLACDYSGSTYYQDVEIWIGTGTDKADFTRQLGDKIELQSTDMTKYEREFTVSTAGNYRVAVRVTKTGFFHGTKCRDFKIDRLRSMTAPGPVSDLTAKASPLGALGATISFKAPLKNCDGGDLTAIDRIEVMRDNTTSVKVFSNPAPGESLSVDDKVTEGGMHNYTVIAYSDNEGGEGERVEVWIGPDVPKAPLTVTATDNLNGSVHLAWTVDETGVNGGYVDNDNLSFDVYQFKSDGTLNLLTTITKKTSTDINLNFTADGYQVMACFAVSVKAGELRGKPQLSNEYIAGTPYKLPFFESFANCETSHLWVVKEGNSEYMFGLLPTKSFDSDLGAAVFHAPTGGNSAAIECGMLDLSGAKNPYLIFRYLSYPGAPLCMKVYARPEGQMETVLLGEVDHAKATGEEEIWLPFTAPLSQFTGKKYTTIIVEGFVDDPKYAVVFDAFEVREMHSADLALSVVDLPEILTEGKQATVRIKIENKAETKSAEGTLTIANGDNNLAEVKVASLDPLASTIIPVSFKVPVGKESLEAVLTIVSEGDENAENNSADFAMSVAPSELPAATGLKAETTEEGVSLTWNEPDTSKSDRPVTDSFEDYTPFIVANIGDWTLYDADGMPTAGFRESAFPHSGEPFAWIVFNPAEAGIDLTKPGMDIYAPATGNQYLAAVTVSGTNDNWLISPRIAAGGQKITFKMRSLDTQYGKETFEVLTSSKTDAPEDFTDKVGSYEVEAKWTDFEVALPADARYFAIRHTSGYVWMMMLDDITYRPQPLEVEGYNIYRDGKLFGHSDKTTFTDATAGKNHTYHVTALYDAGESGFSEAAIVGTGALDTLATDNNAAVTVYDLSGRQIYTGSRSAITSATLVPGVYVIKSAETTAKIVIR